MSDAIVFNGFNSLDFYEIRKNVCRIPEVISRIRQAQELVDEHIDLDFDFLNFILSDDKIFLANIRFKSLAASVVQVGLFDRYLRYYTQPSFMVGNINGDSALKVASGVLSFESMIKRSAAFLVNSGDASPQQVISLQAGNDPVLSGFSLTEYAVFGRLSEDSSFSEEASYAKMEVEQMGIAKIFHRLVDEYGLERIVNIGPGNLLISRTGEDLILDQLAVSESIDLDPMLSWFWPELKQASVAS